MTHRSMAMTLRQKPSLLSENTKRRKAKESEPKSDQFQDNDHYFLWPKVLFTMNTLRKIRRWARNTIWEFWWDYEIQWGENGLISGKAVAGHWIKKPHSPTHLISSRIFLPNTTLHKSISLRTTLTCLPAISDCLQNANRLEGKEIWGCGADQTDCDEAGTGYSKSWV